MKKKTIQISFMMIVSALLLMTALTGCDKNRKTSSGSSANMVPGMWQYYGTLQPEYYVQFTNSEIIYGHMKDGAYVPDHSDRIKRLEETAPGIFKVQAESVNGTHYTYQTCESDHSVMEYYGTWSEEEFPETYSVGASLSSCS